jgi:cell division protein FtsN
VAPVTIRVVGHRQSPSPRQTREREPENCFWVQVGAFGDSGNARRAEAELERSGEKAVVLDGYDELWRVRVGPFDTKNDAEMARNRVTDAWPGARILPCGG